MAIQEYIAPIPTDTPNITMKDIAWLAGILEGEGSFLYRKERSEPSIQISMSDRDIMERVAALFGGHKLSPYQPKGKPTYKLMWCLRLSDDSVIPWMRLLFPLLGQRRQTQIHTVLTHVHGPTYTNTHLERSAEPYSNLFETIEPLSHERLAWIAGLLEGEGSFQWNDSPLISMDLTDKDVIERLAALLSDAPVVPLSPRADHPTYKPVFKTFVCGTDAVGWMFTLYPFLGTRRQSDIVTVIQRWRKAPGFPRGRKGERLPALCHPDRERQGQGLCQECYNRKYHREHPECLSTIPAPCHPDRMIWRNGLCSPCYQQDLRQRRKGQAPKRFATCHPELRMYAKGLCQNCYQQQGHARRKQETQCLIEPEQLALRTL